MNTIKNLKVVESNGASEEFYGDSDADENPFEHSSAHGVEAFAPASLDAQPISGDVLAGAEPGERFSFSTTTASAKSSSSLPVGQLPQDHRRRFPQASGPLTFPAIVGQNNSFITSDLRPSESSLLLHFRELNDRHLLRSTVRYDARWRTPYQYDGGFLPDIILLTLCYYHLEFLPLQRMFHL